MKYEDKLESYYDLCLKRPPQPKNNESKDISTKFVRKSGQKSNTSDLAKAMRLLEAD